MAWRWSASRRGGGAAVRWSLNVGWSAVGLDGGVFVPGARTICGGCADGEGQRDGPRSYYCRTRQNNATILLFGRGGGCCCARRGALGAVIQQMFQTGAGEGRRRRGGRVSFLATHARTSRRCAALPSPCASKIDLAAAAERYRLSASRPALPRTSRTFAARTTTTHAFPGPSALAVRPAFTHSYSLPRYRHLSSSSADSCQPTASSRLTGRQRPICKRDQGRFPVCLQHADNKGIHFTCRLACRLWFNLLSSVSDMLSSSCSSS